MDLPHHGAKGRLTDEEAGDAAPPSASRRESFSDAEHRMDPVGCGVQMLRIAGCLILFQVIMFATMAIIGVFGKIFW